MVTLGDDPYLVVLVQSSTAPCRQECTLSAEVSTLSLLEQIPHKAFSSVVRPGSFQTTDSEPPLASPHPSELSQLEQNCLYTTSVSARTETKRLVVNAA